MGMIILAGLVVFGLVLWGAAVFVKKRRQHIEHQIKIAREHYADAVAGIKKSEKTIAFHEHNKQGFEAEAQRLKDQLYLLGVKVD